MNPFQSMQLIFTSIMANTVVLGIMCSMLILTIGIGILLFKWDTAKEYLLNGGILLAVCMGVSYMQLGAVPLTFEAVGEVGLWSIPSSAFTMFYMNFISWVLNTVGWIASAMVGLGIVFILTKQNSGGKLLLIGLLMTVACGLIGGGGIITFIGNLIGVDVVVLA
ncbi:MAG: hypothetical protein ACFFCS_12200 [Candidatus Hodarchaeota archaeon]